MAYLILVGLFLPLLGFFILALGSSNLGRKGAGIIGCTTVFFSFLIFASLLWVPQIPSYTLFKWLHVGPINADFTLHLDPLAHLMTLIITGVGFLIHLYSNGYMDHDNHVPRFFACMNFFIFSMLLLVLAGDLLLLFVGWEGVGLASYLLIGFWYEKPSAAQAAKKAFVINRIGDLGLLLGLLLTFQLFSTTHIETVSQQASAHASMMPLLAFLFFIGAVGKSAQLPLYTWLPDAMEGPTPVSALIHAATMVTAGVYLVVRMHAVFNLAPGVMELVGLIGGLTSLFAALSALGQTDLKRVLAYSTVSQLGLMFLACGVGAYYSAMFHLSTHAFVKALLFLSAGNVVHMLHDKTEMAHMGGLAKVFPKTHLLFVIGLLALSGIPPLAPFFSKDLILEEESITGHHGLFIVGLAASILTGVYLTRAYWFTFKGHLKEENAKAKEAPLIMLIPVFLLGFMALVGGILELPIEKYIDNIGLTPEEQELTKGFRISWQLVVAAVGGIVGIVSTYLFFSRREAKVDQPIPLFQKSFYVDEIYWKWIALPLKRLASTMANFFEPKLFGGSMRFTAMTAQGAAYQLQQTQSGQIRSYIAWMVLGALLLTLYLVVG